MPSFQTITCCVPEHWTAEHLQAAIAFEYFSIDREVFSNGQSRQVIYAALSSGSETQHEKYLNIQLLSETQVYRDILIDVIEEAIDFPHIFMDITYWPESMSMMRQFLHGLCTAEKSAKIGFYFAIVSAHRYLQIEQNFPFWDFHDLSLHGSATIPKHPEYDSALEIRTSETHGDQYEQFGPQGLLVLI